MPKRFIARGIIALHDAFAALVVAAILVAGFATPAYAYVDPSVMTYTIQALAGVAVALGAVAGVAFRRTRRALFRLLNIDENARKEHDPAWKRTDGAEEPLTSASVKAAAAAKAPEPARGRAENPATPVALPWRKRLLLSLLVAGFAGFTLGIAAPLEIIARNVSSVLFGVGDIWAPMVVFSLVGIVILALALSALRGRAFSIGLALVFSVGLCCWVQAMFLNEIGRASCRERV